MVNRTDIAVTISHSLIRKNIATSDAEQLAIRAA